MDSTDCNPDFIRLSVAQFTLRKNLPCVLDAEEVRKLAIVSRIVNHEVGDLAGLQ